MASSQFLLHFIPFLASYKYILIFLGTIIEGPVLMVASGFMVHQKILDLKFVFIVLVLGDLVGDVVWYFIGYYFIEPLLRKRGHFLKLTPEMFEKGKDLFHKYHIKILIISKITLGFGMALVTLMTAGAMKVPFKKYMLLNLIGEVFLVFILLGVGYFFGQLYNVIAHSMKIYLVIGGFILLGIAIYYFTKYFKHKFVD